MAGCRCMSAYNIRAHQCRQSPPCHKQNWQGTDIRPSYSSADDTRVRRLGRSCHKPLHWNRCIFHLCNCWAHSHGRRRRRRRRYNQLGKGERQGVSQAFGTQRLFTHVRPTLHGDAGHPSTHVAAALAALAEQYQPSPQVASSIHSGAAPQVVPIPIVTEAPPAPDRQASNPASTQTASLEQNTGSMRLGLGVYVGQTARLRSPFPPPPTLPARLDWDPPCLRPRRRRQSLHCLRLPRYRHRFRLGDRENHPTPLSCQPEHQRPQPPLPTFLYPRPRKSERTVHHPLAHPAKTTRRPKARSSHQAHLQHKAFPDPGRCQWHRRRPKSQCGRPLPHPRSHGSMRF